MAHDHKITKPVPDSRAFAQALAESERQRCEPRHADVADSYALGCMTFLYGSLLGHLEDVLARKPGAIQAARREIERQRELAYPSEGDPTGAGTPAGSGDQVHEQRNESPEGMEASPVADGNPSGEEVA